MKELWLEILQTIKRNKWRSIMTAFGIFWGMLMLMILVGLGMGFNNGIRAALKSIPQNSIFYFSAPTTMPYKGFAKNRKWELENKDLQILQNRFKNQLVDLVPINQVGTYKCAYGDKSDDYSLIGTTGGYYDCIPQRIIHGRYINDIDQREHRKVCIIGEKIYKNLFGGSDNPCGKYIRVGDIYYTIIGVAKETTRMISIGSSVDESVEIPISTAQKTYGAGETINMLVCILKNNLSANEWDKKIKAEIKQVHMINPKDPSGVETFNLAEMMKKTNMLFVGISILIWIIGSGTLLAGLIGVSNIMLVTVKERTQEIGIRRALGATPFTILSQIVYESLAITVVAGLAGVTLGVWILHVVDIATKNAAKIDDTVTAFANPQIPFSIAMLALLILLIGGMAAGWMPAKRAMNIKAIDALRDE